MRLYIFIVTALVASISTILVSQPIIKKELNLPRIGDRIIKQQVEYKDPGRAGKDVIWNFGELKSINESYHLAYMAPRLRRDTTYVLGKDTFLLPDNLIVGREHFTNYFYQYNDSIFQLLGYENNIDLMHYIHPLPLLKLPMTFGDSLEYKIQSEDVFSSRVMLNTNAAMSILADAYGMIVLPDGDTLQHVLRIHSIQTQLADSMPTMDSIHVNTTIDNYKWYACGYRYPIFETIKTIHRRDTIEDEFTTAFFYPPQEQYFLSEDTENLMVLDSIRNIIPMGGQSTNPWEGLSYNILPNPVRTDLFLELYLPRSVNNLQVQIRNQMGLLFVNEQKGSFSKGLNTFVFNLSNLPTDNYILDFWLDGYLVHGSVVMKR